MTKKWYKNSTVQAAIVVGVFGVIAAIITGGFALLKESPQNNIKSAAPNRNQLNNSISLLKERISSLEFIVGAYANEENGLIILIGDEAKKKQQVPIRIEDIALALRLSRADNKKIGVAFDSDPGESRFLNVRYMGGVKDTHLGYILYQADRILKEYMLGSRIDGSSIQTSLKDYKSVPNMQRHRKTTPQNLTFSRLWILNSPVVSSEPAAAFLEDLGITINVESMVIRNGKLTASMGAEIDSSAKIFARFFSDNFENLAEDEPNLKAFIRIVQIISISKWLMQHKTASKLSWLESYASDDQYKTPIKIPVIKIQEKVQDMSDDGTRLSSVIRVSSGGISLGIDDKYIHRRSELGPMITEQLIGKKEIVLLGESIRLKIKGKNYIGIILSPAYNKKIQPTGSGDQ